MLQAGHRLGDGFRLGDVHQSYPGGAERTVEKGVIQRQWKHRCIDLAGNQSMDRLGVIQIHQTGGGIERPGSFQNVEHERPRGCSRRSDGQTLAAELREPRDRLGIPVEDEYRRIGYAAEGVQDVRVGRSREAKSTDGCRHAGGSVAQHIEMLYHAGIVAHLELDAVAREYPRVHSRKAVVPGSRYPGSDCEVTRW
jgi:hypothetical protein